MDGIRVSILVGSMSDWKTMKWSARALDMLKVEWEAHVISAHRTPEFMRSYASNAQARGIMVIIAGAGGAAHLPGMVSANTVLPVLGVPIESTSLAGMDSLLSIVQMPRGIPVGTLAIGIPGAFNAGLLAAAILGVLDSDIWNRLKSFRHDQEQAVLSVKLF